MMSPAGAWVKMRIGGGQEFVIADCTPCPENVDSLLVAYYMFRIFVFPQSHKFRGHGNGRRG
jgi:hypothetical protein